MLLIILIIIGNKCDLLVVLLITCFCAWRFLVCLPRVGA